MVRTLLCGRSVVNIETHGYAITVEDEEGEICMNWHAQAALQTESRTGGEAEERIVGDPQRMSGLDFAGRNPPAARQKEAIGASLVPIQQKLAALQAKVKGGLKLTKQPAIFRESWRVDPDPERDNDGLLRARDVLALDLSETLLVVLAACQTGLGLQTDGEGALGLGRAFLVAGTRFAVVSQWQVPANASARMFTDFYRRVTTDGTPPPLALQQAQVNAIERLRKQGVKHSAFIWGAFTPLAGYGRHDDIGRVK